MTMAEAMKAGRWFHVSPIATPCGRHRSKNQGIPTHGFDCIDCGTPEEAVEKLKRIFGFTDRPCPMARIRPGMRYEVRPVIGGNIGCMHLGQETIVTV